MFVSIRQLRSTIIDENKTIPFFQSVAFRLGVLIAVVVAEERLLSVRVSAKKITSVRPELATQRTHRGKSRGPGKSTTALAS